MIHTLILGIGIIGDYEKFIEKARHIGYYVDTFKLLEVDDFLRKDWNKFPNFVDYTNMDYGSGKVEVIAETGDTLYLNINSLYPKDKLFVLCYESHKVEEYIHEGVSATDLYYAFMLFVGKIRESGCSKFQILIKTY